MKHFTTSSTDIDKIGQAVIDITELPNFQSIEELEVVAVSYAQKPCFYLVLLYTTTD